MRDNQDLSRKVFILSEVITSMQKEKAQRKKKKRGDKFEREI
jgi:hypothetical protein